MENRTFVIFKIPAVLVKIRLKIGNYNSILPKISYNKININELQIANGSHHVSNGLSIL